MAALLWAVPSRLQSVFKDELWPPHYKLPESAFTIATSSDVWAVPLLQFHNVKGGKERGSGSYADLPEGYQGQEGGLAGA